jgi:hypothetical protein
VPKEKKKKILARTTDPTRARRQTQTDDDMGGGGGEEDAKRGTSTTPRNNDSDSVGSSSPPTNTNTNNANFEKLQILDARLGLLEEDVADLQTSQDVLTTLIVAAPIVLTAVLYCARLFSASLSSGRRND